MACWVCTWRGRRPPAPWCRQSPTRSDRPPHLLDLGHVSLRARTRTERRDYRPYRAPKTPTACTRPRTVPRRTTSSRSPAEVKLPSRSIGSFKAPRVQCRFIGVLRDSLSVVYVPPWWRKKRPSRDWTAASDWRARVARCSGHSAVWSRCFISDCQAPTLLVYSRWSPARCAIDDNQSRCDEAWCCAITQLLPQLLLLLLLLSVECRTIAESSTERRSTASAANNKLLDKNVFLPQFHSVRLQHTNVEDFDTHSALRRIGHNLTPND